VEPVKVPKRGEKCSARLKKDREKRERRRLGAYDYSAIRPKKHPGEEKRGPELKGVYTKIELRVAVIGMQPGKWFGRKMGGRSARTTPPHPGGPPASRGGLGQVESEPPPTRKLKSAPTGGSTILSSNFRVTFHEKK